MTIDTTSRPLRRALWAVCATALVGSAAFIPQAVAPTRAAAADTCQTGVPTYVLESSGGTGPVNIAKPRTLRKYLDWAPQSADGALVDTGVTAQVPGLSRLVAGGSGVIYEITKENTLKAYKDNSATGGSLLTPVKTYSLAWASMKRVWSNGARIFAQDSTGAVTVYKQSAPSTGDGTISVVGTVPASDKLTEITSASSVWMVGSTVYTLKNGTVAHRTYSEVTEPATATPVLRLGDTTSDISGLADAVAGWSPGPGTFNTVTSAADYSGIVRKYTGAPATLANDDLSDGVFGQILADTASCLADPAGSKPVFGDAPESAGTQAPDTVPDDSTPQITRTVSGKFTLGSGKGAPGLRVTVTALDAGTEQTADSMKPTVLGTATTSADGSWTVTLPEKLPAEVQTVVDDNGGVLNLQAMTDGTSSSGVSVLGVDHLIAAPSDTSDGQPTAFAAGASDGGHTVALVPTSADGSLVGSNPTDEQEKQTFAADVAQSSVASDAPDPLWQSDKSKLPADYSPFVVNGKDISSETVTPQVGGCNEAKYKESSKIAYTTVGEAHAFYDAKAAFTYGDSMSSSIDIATNSSGNWSIGTSKGVGSSTGRSLGFSNRGPNWAKQYKVPIEYIKYKHVYYCDGFPRDTWKTIEPNRYKVPAGGETAKMGKDVRSKDGQHAYVNSPRRNRAILPKGQFWELNRTRSSKWSSSVSVYGLTLGASTQYDRQHAQRITAGNQPQEHDIWGQNDSLNGKPGIVLSY
ncbi:hypothetical protein [Streptomyces sp. NPDC054804]